MEDINNKTLNSLPGTVGGLLNGQPVTSNDHLLPVVNPDSGEVLLQLAESDAAEVDRAVAAAKSCFDGGSWSRASTAERQQVLMSAANLIRNEAETLAAQDSLCTGILYHKSTLGQARFAAAGWFDYFAHLIGGSGDELYRQLPNTKTLVTREPVGVAGLFTPWNIPLMSAALKLSAALAMGNSCVIKPSEQSPLSTYRLVEILHEAGLPEGVLQLVNGRGSVTGAALADHPDIDLISFTGGEQAGRSIAIAAAQRFAKVTMELGGKSATIIFDDADYDAALNSALQAIYSNNGQACLAGSRILVQKGIAERFIADFVALTQKLRIGRPFDSNADLGPLSSASHLARVLSYADAVNEEGGELLIGGQRAAGFQTGNYIQPTVALVTDNRTRVCQEEIFGPFVTIVSFDTEQQAIDIANDTRFGLAGYVWSNNLNRALRVSDQIRSGYVLINSAMQRERNAPFGGFGHSGVEREGGKFSMSFYSELKTTLINQGNTEK